MEQFRSLKYPPTVFWEVTDRCNHNCVHCFNYWRTDKEALVNSELKSEEEYLEIAKRILERKPVKVVITGGEPLIAFKFLIPTLEFFHENKVDVSFNTNAALLTEEIAEYFEKNNISMFISFPSAKAEEFDRIVDTPGAFDRVITAMELAKKHNLRFSTNMVVSKVNLHSIFETAQFLKNKFDVKYVSITRVSMPINARAHFDEYMLTAEELDIYMEQCLKTKDELKLIVKASSPFTPCSLTSQSAYDLFAFEGGCEAGKFSYVITSEGRVRACARDIKEYGDFINEPFEEIWERMSEWRDETFIPKECDGCAQRSFCRGGCRIDGVAKCGERDRLDFYSDINRLPISFTKKKHYLPTWDYTTAFEVHKTVQFVEEEFGVRVSSRGNCRYCTPKFSEFLKATPEFTLYEFCNRFDVPLKQAIAVIDPLVSKGIIITKRRKGEEGHE